MGDHGSQNDHNFVELFVKAGKDGKSYGACPFCQRIFMILLMKAEMGTLVFRVTTVNPNKHPPEFKLLSNRLPTLVHGNEVLKDNQEIVDYIDEHFPMPNLAYKDREAEAATLHVFSKFTYFVKEVSNSALSLIGELRRIDDHLRESGFMFLCSDAITHLDCLILPKLQHIRVAAKAYKDFDIPHDLKYLWRYLQRAYVSEVFQKSCPSDQEIVYHWASKPETPNLSLEKEHLFSPELTEPTFSWQVPRGVQ